MKKLLGILTIIVFGLTGCGAGVSNTMSCTYENTDGNLTSKMSYKIDYQGDEVKKLRITYNYHYDNPAASSDMDGVGTGTDGTTNDTQIDNDGIIDGVVGSAIDSLINGITGTILDISGLRDRHATVQSTYGGINGFAVQNTSDVGDNDYTVTYIIDYDNISDNDLNILALSRDINILKSNYENQGFTCNY